MGPAFVPYALLLVGTVFGVLSASLSKSIRYQAPDECKWVMVEGGNSEDDVALVCRLRTINSELENTNFSVIQPQHTVRLRLECSDGLFFQSSLSAGSFTPLVELRELSIEYCKIGNLSDGAFKGLKQLKNLTVKTHNTDWSSMSLEIAPDAFDDELKQIERLDLGENNMWSIPPGLLCPLYNLQILNMTHNRLRDISEFHFSNNPSERCGANLKLLDLSRNKIDRFLNSQLAALNKLQKLYLQGNGLSYLADRALEGLNSLNVLKLSDNKLVSLPPELFADTKEIKELYLQNNSLNVLAPGLLNELTQLLVLDLSHNSLTTDWINAATFTGLVRLIVLDLSFNKIGKLEQFLFRDLYNLQILRLNDNNIENIPDNIFSALYNLHTLIISNNKITKIDVDTFNGLYVLSLLSIDNNKISNINNDALKNCSNLKDLHLNGNKLLEVPQVLNNVLNLKTLDLGENHIESIYSDSFPPLRSLYGLRLTENNIGNITKVFDNMPSLKILNLSKNKIQKITPGAFDQNKNLQAIRLDGNYLNDVEELFAKLPHLVWLNVSDNRLKWFDYALIPITLQWLDIHHNQIKELGNYFEIESTLSLSTFDASHNKLTEITGSSIPNSVEVLFLNDNLISKVQSYTFFKKPNLTRVDLFGNKITHLDPNSLRISTVPLDKPLPEFHVGGNPYECDCTMEWLQKVNGGSRARTQPKLVDLESIYCQLLYNRGRRYVPLVEATPNQFLCPYETHCFALCHCCDFDACDCEMTCPNNCTCYHDQSWSANIVDCSSAGYDQKLPEKIPMYSTEVYLDGNNFSSLSSHAFLGRKKLKILYLNNSNIDVIQNQTFNSLVELEILHIDNNNIKELRGYEFENLEKLQEIFLQNNMISQINNTTFLTLRRLRVLKLDGNKLFKYNVWLLPKSLNEVTLSNNRWSCDCDFIERLKEWSLINNRTTDIYEIKCVHNSTENITDVSLYIMSNISLCIGESNIIQSNLTLKKTILEQHVHNHLPLLIAILSVLSSVVLFMLIIFAYRLEMRVWCHSKFGLRLFQHTNDSSTEDREKLFDAFVSYSSKDEAWVAEVLTPALEPHYKLCLHYRDFPVGAFLQDSIAQAVESSKRTIMILSDNFIKSEWGRYEFKSAHHQVLRDRRKRLIVVLLGDVQQKDLDPDIRLYLKTNVYLRWGEKLFWEKLKYALPDVSNHRLCGSTRGSHVHHHVHRHGSCQQGNPPGNGPRTVAIHI